jgi:hypothetical protein
MSMNLNGRKIKAPYQTIGPRKEMVTYTKTSKKPKNKDGTGGEFITETVTEEMDTWLVKFAMGHSTRFVGERGREELIRMGYHKKPRLIDMETGDVVDIGGDPYDLDTHEEPIREVVLSDE